MATSPPQRFILRVTCTDAIGLVAAVFFSVSYLDERELNVLEDQFDAVVAAPSDALARSVWLLLAVGAAMSRHRR